MSEIEFMSSEHVQRMNVILGGDTATRRACAELDRDYFLVYALKHEPVQVYWTTRFSPNDGVTFSLKQPTQTPDVLYVGDYVRFMRATRALKTGQVVEVPLRLERGEETLSMIMPIFELARKTASLKTTVPEL